MDQTISITNDANIKTSGKTSPIAEDMGGGQGIGGAGRTMKEYEDQLSTLKKENFNLKLRIYFLEERMGITSADEDAIKKNIELKVENESLRKELIEKQELLSQAAKAIELIEEQKQVYVRHQTQYQQTLEQERERVDKLEKELEKYREKLTDTVYYEKTFGITPEKALEFKEKLYQVEEIKSSFELELKQLLISLEEERNWAQELENEKDQLRNRLESEIQSKEKLFLKKDHEIETLNEKIKQMEEKLLKIENLLQQLKKEIIEKNKIIDEKTFLLDEKCTTLDEIMKVSEKRKKQVDQLRLSIKSRDDALTDLNNRNRCLLAQFENNYIKNSSSLGNPSIFIEESQSFKKTLGLLISTKNFNDTSELEPVIERNRSICDCHTAFNKMNIQELKNELDNKEREIKKKEEAKQQLMLKLYSVQQSAEENDQKLKKLEIDHRKAIQMIQGFVKRHEQLEDKQAKKDQKIIDLEVEVSKLRSENIKVFRSGISASLRKNHSNEVVNNAQHDDNVQQQYKEMESKIHDFQDENKLLKTGKILLERKIQIENEVIHDQFQDKDLKIECLQCQKNSTKYELQEKKEEELDKCKNFYKLISFKKEDFININYLQKKLIEKKLKLEEKSQQVDQLTKELLIKTQNLQKLVNTELLNKNKKIKKLHNHMNISQFQEKNYNKINSAQENAIFQLNSLIKELNDIGLQVTFANNIMQLNYVNSNKIVDITMITKYVHKLIAQKNELETEIDYFKWLKLLWKPINNRDKYYCEVLKIHLKELAKFLNEIFKNIDHTAPINSKKKKIVFDLLINSKILSNDFMNVLEDLSFNKLDNTSTFNSYRINTSLRKNKFHNIMNFKYEFSTLDSKAKPNRIALLTKIGFPEIKWKSMNKLRFSKLTKAFSDFENSIDYYPCRDSYQDEINDFDVNQQILEVKKINNFLYYEINILKNNVIKNTSVNVINTKLSVLLSKLLKSQNHCEKLQNTLDKKINKYQILKKESKQHSICKIQLEKKNLEIEEIIPEITKYKTIIFQSKSNIIERLTSLINDNEVLKLKIEKLEEESKKTKIIILKLTKELDQLTVLHSQISVENTKLTNDKLRLEQEIRKIENQCDQSVQTVYDRFTKKYWLPTIYTKPNDWSKSNCSLDLGIENDSVTTSIRPFKNILKITESMTNLLSDNDHSNNNQKLWSSDNSMSLPEKGSDIIRMLKQENIILKKRLVKTRRALEDTFRHLSASNKNKKNVEKAITKQLMITKSVLTKTKNCKDTYYEN